MEKILRGNVWMKDLSDPDRRTLHLRGASGRFKPENPTELQECIDAKAQGASKTLEAWTVIDRADGRRLREQYNSCCGHDADGLPMKTPNVEVRGAEPQGGASLSTVMLGGVDRFAGPGKQIGD